MSRRSHPIHTHPVFRDIYHQNALWACFNRKTGECHTVAGALAQILKQYPADYELTFVSPEGIPDEYDA